MSAIQQLASSLRDVTHEGAQTSLEVTFVSVFASLSLSLGSIAYLIVCRLVSRCRGKAGDDAVRSGTMAPLPRSVRGPADLRIIIIPVNLRLL